VRALARLLRLVQPLAGASGSRRCSSREGRGSPRSLPDDPRPSQLL